MPQPICADSRQLCLHSRATAPQPTILPAMPAATNSNPNKSSDTVNPSKLALMPIFAKKTGEKIMYELMSTLRSI